MRRKLATKNQARPSRRKLTSYLSLAKQMYANRKVILSMFCALIAAATWGIGYMDVAADYMAEKSRSLFTLSGLAVKEILVEGREHTPPQEIMSALNVSKGVSIFNLKPAEAQKSLESIPWVYSAMVQRRLPATIYVRISEREPIAIWQKDSKHYLIDAKGSVIDQFSKSEFSDLIVITGKEANIHAHEFLTLLQGFPGLLEHIKGAAFVGGRRWDLILENKVRVKLPEKKPEEALERLLKMQQEHKLADGHLNTIDLRLPDRSFLYVQPQEHDKKNKGNVT